MTERVHARGHLSVTVVDVAKLAGVSAMTVSRALNRPSEVPAATVAKVRAAVEQSGYVPNRMAGALRSSQSHLVAAVVPTLSSPVFMDTIEALTAGLASRGYHLMVGQSGYHESREDDLLTDIIGRRPDGIVLTGVMHTPTGRQKLIASGIPVIETWDLTVDPIDMLIGFSHEAVGRAVAQHFHRSGRRRLALIGADDVRSMRRWQAFRDEAVAMGLQQPEAEFVAAPARFGDGRHALSSLLTRQPAVDGIFCSSDLVAHGVLAEAQERGIRVPARIALVGFGDLNFARDTSPALTTVRVDGRHIGELAAQCMVTRAQRKDWPERVIDVGFEIIRRSSG